MICFPNAKINLGLHVDSKRDDGFHNIESVFYPIPFFDVLEFFPSEKFSLTNSGLDIDVPPEENLVSRAWSLLNQRFGIPPVSIHLLKMIPSGAGLGGGSADASFFIKELNRFFNLELAQPELISLSAELGSDCPFFIQNTPSLVQGKGEIMSSTEALLKGYSMVVIFTGMQVSTREAFSGIQPEQKGNHISSVYTKGIKYWKDELINDFEKFVFSLHPDLKVIKNTLYENGAIYASLSGSGSAMYGIFRQQHTQLAFNRQYMIRWLSL